MITPMPVKAKRKKSPLPTNPSRQAVNQRMTKVRCRCSLVVIRYVIICSDLQRPLKVGFIE